MTVRVFVCMFECMTVCMTVGMNVCITKGYVHTRRDACTHANKMSHADITCIVGQATSEYLASVPVCT